MSASRMSSQMAPIVRCKHTGMLYKMGYQERKRVILAVPRYTILRVIVEVPRVTVPRVIVAVPRVTVPRVTVPSSEVCLHRDTYKRSAAHTATRSTWGSLSRGCTRLASLPSAMEPR